MRLRCRNCGREYPLEPLYVCEFCFGPLEVEYDYDRLVREWSRREVESGPASMWRYRPLLPFTGEEPCDIGTGFTPLLRAENLGRALGLKNLYLKNDSVNPTFSFKDRVVSVAISQARLFGFEVVGCASTGNLAASVAAHAARAGMSCFVFIPVGLERGKVMNTAVYGPRLITVRGNYDDVNRLCIEIADRYRWAFLNINLRPYYAEGSKTLAFEVAEQLGWTLPQHVVVPIAGGSLLTKVDKGFRELVRLGWVEDAPYRIHGAQAEGCAPVVRAFLEGKEEVSPVRPQTIAKSLAIGNPADGYYALRVIRRTGGKGVAVTDAEIVEAIGLLARTEGIFTETAGGVTIAALRRLAGEGAIGPEEVVVALITGNGLKTLEALEGTVPESFPEIDPHLRAFRELYEAMHARAIA